MRLRLPLGSMLLALVSCLATSPHVLAQEPPSVLGTVVDGTGTPVERVRVAVRDRSGAIRSVETDRDGRFVLERLADGPAQLSAEAIGWQPIAQSIGVPVEGDDLRLVLRPAGIEETVVVIGTRTAQRTLHPESADLIGSVDIVGSDQLERENVDLSYELLKKVPGVYVSDYNQGIVAGGIGIRGFNTEGDVMHTKLLVDGIPTNLNSGVGQIDAVFPLLLDRIEIVKGTQDPRYGQFNIAGNIQAFTSPPGRYTKVKLLGGAFGTADFQGVTAFTTGRLSHVYFAGYRESAGYRRNSDLDRYAFSGKWFYVPAGEAWQIGVIARTYDFDTQAPGYLTDDELASDPRQSPAFSATDGGTQHTNHVSLHADRQLTSTLTLSAKTYYQTFAQQRWVRFTAATPQQERLEDEAQSGLLATMTWRPAEWSSRDVSLSWGADYQYQNNLAQRFGTVNRVRSATTRHQDFDLANGGAYLSSDVRPVPWLRLTGGIRADRFGGGFVNRLTGGDLPVLDYGTIWQPKAAAMATLRDGVIAYGNYGRSFQAGVGAAAYGTQALASSKNDGWETGLRLAPAAWLTTRVGVWGQDASDELRLKFDNSGDSENVGRTRRRGWNLDVTVRPHATTYLWGTVTQQRATLVEPGATQPELRGKELNHLPRVTAKTGVDVSPGGPFSLSLWTDVQSAYYLTTANVGPKLGDRRLVHADVLLRVGRRTTIGGHVKNLFDGFHEYAWYDGTTVLHSPGESRAAYVTSTWEF